MTEMKKPESLKDIEDRLKAAFEREIFFVVGSPQSGGTRVQRMLDAHPEIRCAGEGHFTDWFGPPLKDLLGEYNDRLAANNEALYHGQGHYTGYTTGDFRYLLKTAMGLAWAKLDLPPEKRLLGEKTPILTQRLEFLEILFPEAKVLHVVRDGREATASAVAQRLSQGGDPALTPGSPAWYDLVAAAARGWSEATRACLVFGASRPERYHEVRTEDLHADPRPHLGAVLRFLGAGDTPSDIDACLTAVGEPPATAPLFETLLDERARQFVIDLQGPLLRQFDYLD
ncbi:sulfotransferase [Azospirillum sp.]|uniref:sulfotransferase family protein n=1 Tax=Azospirillum sp. TaxID=34012 RepID=UPI002D66FA48|nr:sulfotransferase [Azospirillum sp.]HYD65191.1 sulfotransferase [Azospirillum sp.]